LDAAPASQATPRTQDWFNTPALIMNKTLSGSIAAATFRAGPLTSAGAIFWVHGDNMVRHGETYAESPPTISHALHDPSIAGPFALAMIVSALFLSLAIGQVMLAIYRIVGAVPVGRRANFVLLDAISVCEAVAVAGMIVLSQYTGSINSLLHDVGSYMLFFGHAIGITLSGWLISRLLDAAPEQSIARKQLETVRRNPRRALAIALLSAFYGVVYFGGKVLPDQYDFWQGAILSTTEVIVILAFLAYFSTFWPLVKMSRSKGPGGQVVGTAD
jgi:hypothetical protein